MALYTRKRARRSLFDTVLFRALSQGATLLGYVVLVRGLTEHEFGVFNLLYATMPVISTVASLGLEHTLRRYQPEYLRGGQLGAAARLVSFVAGARFAANLAILGIILAAWNVAAPLFDLGPYRAEFAVFGLIVLLHFQARVLQLSLSSHMLHRYAVGMLAALSVVKLAAYLACAALDALTLQTAIASDVAASVVFYLGLYGAHRRHCVPPREIRERFRFERAERRRLLRYGLFYNFNDAGSLAMNARLDNFYIAALMDTVAVGTYSFYMRLSQMAAQLLPTSMFQNVVQPLFFAIRRDEAPERIPRYFSALLDSSLLVQMPILAYATAYHREIVAVLFAGKFIEHSALLPLVLAFATFNVIANPVTLVAQHAEKAFVILLSKIFALYHIAALLVLIPWAGVAGAAIATGTAEALKNLFIWWHVRREARWTNALGALGASLATWGLFVAASFALKAALPAPDMFHLVIGAGLAAATALCYVRTAALSAADRNLFASILHGRETRLLRLLGVVPVGEGEREGPKA